VFSRYQILGSISISGKFSE